MNSAILKILDKDFTRRGFLTALGALSPLFLLPSGIHAASASKRDPALTFIRRADWSGFQPNLRRLNEVLEFTRLTIHHEGNAVNMETDEEQVRNHLNGILEAHLERRFGDIAYHFMVDYAGRIWEGRSLLRQGAHVASQNSNNIGVMLLGNFEEQDPAPAQLRALDKLVAILRKQYGIPRSSVFGHCDIGATLCPGRRLYEPYILAMRESPLHLIASKESQT